MRGERQVSQTCRIRAWIYANSAIGTCLTSRPDSSGCFSYPIPSVLGNDNICTYIGRLL